MSGALSWVDPFHAIHAAMILLCLLARGRASSCLAGPLLLQRARSSHSRPQRTPALLPTALPTCCASWPATSVSAHGKPTFNAGEDGCAHSIGMFLVLYGWRARSSQRGVALACSAQSARLGETEPFSLAGTAQHACLRARAGPLGIPVAVPHTTTASLNCLSTDTGDVIAPRKSPSAVPLTYSMVATSLSAVCAQAVNAKEVHVGE